MTKLEPAGVLREKIELMICDECAIPHIDLPTRLAGDVLSLVINEVLSGLPKYRTHAEKTKLTIEQRGAYNLCLDTIKQQLEGLNGGGK
jgi:protein-arginine kinase activator protein McsA